MWRLSGSSLRRNPAQDRQQGQLGSPEVAPAHPLAYGVVMGRPQWAVFAAVSSAASIFPQCKVCLLLLSDSVFANCSAKMAQLRVGVDAVHKVTNRFAEVHEGRAGRRQSSRMTPVTSVHAVFSCGVYDTWNPA